MISAGHATNSVTLVEGTTAKATDVENKVNPLYTGINNSNIETSAGIIFSKLDSSTVCSLATVQTISAIKTFSANVQINATVILYLDGGGDTYIRETSANVLDLTVGGTLAVSINSGGELLIPAIDPPTTITRLNRNSIVKGYIDVDFVAGAPADQGSYNVSGLTDNADGDTTVIWDTDMASITYAVSATAKDPGGTDPVICTWITKVAGSIIIRTRNRSAGALVNNQFTLVACGG